MLTGIVGNRVYTVFTHSHVHSSWSAFFFTMWQKIPTQKRLSSEWLFFMLGLVGNFSLVYTFSRTPFACKTPQRANCIMDMLMGLLCETCGTRGDTSVGPTSYSQPDESQPPFRTLSVDSYSSCAMFDANQHHPPTKKTTSAHWSYRHSSLMRSNRTRPPRCSGAFVWYLFGRTFAIQLS